MWTLLFDIDGTLIHTGGAGMVAIRRTLNEMFGIEPDSVQRVPVHGRTDRAIIADLFAQFSLSLDEHLESFNRRYWQYLPDTLKTSPGRILPGVVELLEHLGQRDDTVLGLLTGNAEVAARIKLEHFGLDHFFHFGGYGDHHPGRNDVARIARQNAERHLDQQFNPQRLWVIGDTVHDVNCARSIESRVLVVGTGGVAFEELTAADPDCHLVDLSEADSFVDAVYFSS